MSALEVIALEEIAEINPPLPKVPDGNTTVSFVPMSAVDEKIGSIALPEERHYSEVCKGYTPFIDGDILVAKITPCFENGKIAHARIPHQVGIGSTEFHVIRPVEGKVDSRYLLHLLRQERVLRTGEIKMTGSGGQRRIPEHFLKSLEVPLPPLPEQRRIAAVLDRTEALRAKRRAAIPRIAAFAQSLFLNLVGDPKSNPKGWPQVELGSLLATTPNFGTMIPPVAERCGWLSLRVGNIQQWSLDLTDRKYVDLPPESHDRHSVQDGDLLLARAIASQDHLGKCVVVYPHGEQWAFDSHLMRLRFDRNLAEPEFIRHLLMTPGGRSRFLKASRQSTVQFNINTKEISALRVPVPPVSIQQAFVSTIVRAQRLEAVHTQGLHEIDSLFSSLQHRAFRGEL